MKTQIELPLAWDTECLVVELPGRAPARLVIGLTAGGADLHFVTRASGAPALPDADPIALRLQLTAPVAIDASPRLRWLLLRHDPERGSWLEFALRLIRRIARVAMAGRANDPGKSLTRNDETHAALDRALARTADHLWARIDRRCWQLAQRFEHLDPLALYRALVDDRSGRLAQLAECTPGLLTLVLAAPPAIAEPMRAAVLAGQPTAALLDRAVQLWAQHAAESQPVRSLQRWRQLCALQRQRLASAGPAVRWELLQSPPAGDFDAADIPLETPDNARWFALVDALPRAADASAATARTATWRGFTRFVARHHDFFASAALPEQWRPLLARLWDFVRATRYVLQLRDQPADLLATGLAWHSQLGAAKQPVQPSRVAQNGPGDRHQRRPRRPRAAA